MNEMLRFSTNSEYIYPENVSLATLGCEGWIIQQIRTHGDISFAEFMQHALYHPELGYYSNATPSTGEKIGKNGDFFTSVSVGSVFGTIIAYRIAALWEEIGKPADFHIIELGANTGDLCIDIMQTLQSIQPDISWQYEIIEPLPHNIDIQKRQFAEQEITPVRHHTSLNELSVKHGAILSNELIDAFPVELLKYHADTSATVPNAPSWSKAYVTVADDSLHLEYREISEDSAEYAFIQNIDTSALPNDYLTEFRPGLAEFSQQTFDTIESGAIITIDYGFPAPYYYIPERTDGTLQCYHRHKKSTTPLENPGKKDITAHVDFTHLESNLITAGWQRHDFSPQYRYLTNHGKPWLLGLEGSPTKESTHWLKQFQTLTHPDMLGGKFHVLEMIK